MAPTPDNAPQQILPRLDGIRLNWSEAARDENLYFADMGALQEWFEQSHSEEDIPGERQGYLKTNLTLLVTDAQGQPHEVTERIDVSVTESDFHPHRIHISKYMVGLLAEYGLDHAGLRQGVPENTITYGGRTQEPPAEIITGEEVEASMRRIKAAERYRQTEITVPQPENPAAAAQRTEPGTATEMQTDNRPTPSQPSKPILGLDYPSAEGLEARYVRMKGKYLDAGNVQTVMFEDKGRSIKTARHDTQTVSDMLDTAQAKNWDGIKISGSRKFIREMWLEAELRGIASSGYRPTKEDLALRDQLREQRERNGIEAEPQRHAERERRNKAAPPRPIPSCPTNPPVCALPPIVCRHWPTHRTKKSPPTKPPNG